MYGGVHCSILCVTSTPASVSIQSSSSAPRGGPPASRGVAATCCMGADSHRLAIRRIGSVMIQHTTRLAGWRRRGDPGKHWQSAGWWGVSLGLPGGSEVAAALRVALCRMVVSGPGGSPLHRWFFHQQEAGNKKTGNMINPAGLSWWPAASQALSCVRPRWRCLLWRT